MTVVDTAAGVAALAATLRDQAIADARAGDPLAREFLEICCPDLHIPTLHMTPRRHTTMAKISELYPSDFIKAEDLAGRTVTVTIAEVTQQAFRQEDGSEQQRVAVHFSGKKKRLVLNATQARTLGHLLGDDTDKWIGAHIMLSPQQLPNGRTTIHVAGVPSEVEGQSPF